MTAACESRRSRALAIFARGYFAPKSLRFWCTTFVVFCLCCLLGHALEYPYCLTMDALFGIVADDYAVFVDPWYVPYWVYGFGALGMTLVIEPVRGLAIERRKTTAGALLETFVFAVLLCAVLETGFGLLINQPDAAGVYPFWDNSKLPGNILQQGWIVNDLAIGAAAMAYLWVIFPLASTLIERLSHVPMRLLVSGVATSFAACCCATAVYLWL